MLKRWILLLLALISLPVAACAEVYAGTTVALETVAVCAQASGTVSACAQAGQRVGAGEALAELAPERAFASQDGTVALVSAAEGDDVDGEVLQIAPAELYTIHCTVDKAYQSAASTLVHGGETVYVKCTADGSHRAIGVVTQIDGDEYRVLTVGGELYVGETVYLYRDEAFTTAQRVGIGTVVASNTQSCTASGRLTRLCVAAGDTVERGQLLYEIGGGVETAPVSGIVTEIACHPGDAVEKDQVVAAIVPDDAVGVEVSIDETDAARVAVGDAVTLTFAGREDAVPGVVAAILDGAESGAYTLRIDPETDECLPLGMTVEVRIS